MGAECTYAAVPTPAVTPLEANDDDAGPFLRDARAFEVLIQGPESDGELGWASVCSAGKAGSDVAVE
jgi:hypothetical protein